MESILNKAGRTLFAKHIEKYTPQDPLYEYYTDNKGRKKRRKRELPPGLSRRDAAILKSVQARAHYLDKSFHLFGFNFGWSFFIAIVPVIGDAAILVLNYYLVVRKARTADLPPWLVQRMLFNTAVSASVGVIPIVGDVVLAMYKANSRNAALLEEFLRVRGQLYLDFQKRGEAVAGGGPEKSSGNDSDARQVKPGAGIVEGEVIPPAPSAGSVVTPEQRSPSGNEKRKFSLFRKSDK